MSTDLELLTTYDPLVDLKLDFIRRLRNSVRFNMTGNHKFIGFAEQQLWFESLDHESFKVFLFWVNDKPAGYGIVRHDSPRVVLTGALLEEFRGRGNGRKLFTLLVNYALKYWWWPSLDVLATNQPALNLYKSLGFIEVDRNGEVISMTLKP